MIRTFTQVDVFTDKAYFGNPVAVVHDAHGLTTQEMQRFANWTNLSETTFLLPPSSDTSDYRVRIFTPSLELPFAGHPTLGSCHAWLAAGGVPRRVDLVVQECAAGLVPVRRPADGPLAFAAPSLIRSGPVDSAVLDEIRATFGFGVDEIIDAEWADNGPGWVAVLLRSADAVLEAQVRAYTTLDIGLVGFYPEGGDVAYEVRGFFPSATAVVEDPVTGSLNASVAQWLLRTGRVTAPYIAGQGTVLQRRGRIAIDFDERDVWVGGQTVSCITGTVDL